MPASREKPIREKTTIKSLLGSIKTLVGFRVFMVKIAASENLKRVTGSFF
jgi:hypothetical protein